MKPKFKTYCTLFIVAVIACLCLSTITTAKDAVHGFVEGWNEQGDSREPIPFQIRMHSDQTIELPMVLDQNSNTQLQQSTNTCLVTLPSELTPAGSNALLIIGGLLIAVSFFLFWYYFIRLILKIRKSNIFSQDISSCLMRNGLSLILIYVGEWLHDAAQYLDSSVLAIEGLTPDIVTFHNNMLLMTGTGLMLIAQIILMGKEMKKEQELTI